MKSFISLLRGINVGGKNLISMKDLKSIYENLGLKDVKTILQSGNVTFKSDLKIEENQISKAILETLGLDIKIFLFEKEEFEDILNQNPFLNEKESYITFFDQKISSTDNLTLSSKISISEKIHLTPFALYLFCEEGYGKTKISNIFVEKTLNIAATTRNSNTSNKTLKETV